MWNNTSGSDGDVGEELVKFLIVPDGEHDVPWADPGLLVITSDITSRLENCNGEVFENSG